MHHQSNGTAQAGASRIVAAEPLARDPHVRPQDDLFGHVNGRWLDETEIPSDKSSWGAFIALADAAEQQVRDIITERDPIAEPVIIAYRFISDVERIQADLRKHGFDPVVFDGASSTKRAWNAGKIPIMLLQPASAAHGLNLQDGGHRLIWFALPDSSEKYQQTNARLHRLGQQHPVDIAQLTVKGTVDARLPGVAHGLPAAVDVGQLRAGEAADHRVLGLLRDLGDCGEVAFRGDGKARLDDVHAHLVQHLGDLELLGVRHGGARRLLAVAQGGVVEVEAGDRDAGGDGGGLARGAHGVIRPIG